jgi:hypothetical protein
MQAQICITLLVHDLCAAHGKGFSSQRSFMGIRLRMSHRGGDSTDRYRRCRERTPSLLIDRSLGNGKILQRVDAVDKISSREKHEI